MMGTSTNSFEKVNRLLILGNGFDLNLGFKTGYEDFVTNTSDNGQFPFNTVTEETSKLGRFIHKCTSINNWYDLENILAEFGKTKPVLHHRQILKWYYNLFRGTNLHTEQYYVKTDKHSYNDYNLLIDSLTKYLRSVDIKNPKRDSVAARLMKELFHLQMITPTIFTFNYTDLKDICSSLLYTSIDPPIYVHGSLAEDNIILGVGDYADLRPTANYLYKTSSAKYRSTNLAEALEIANEIYIFGLSLSQVDYPYFEDFFRDIASRKSVSQKKYIRIFTFDSTSRLSILFNLRKMNEGMIKLEQYADIDIIRTKDDVDEDKFIEVLRRLKQTQSLL